MPWKCSVCGKRLLKPTTAILTADGIMCLKHYRQWIFDREKKTAKRQKAN